MASDMVGERKSSDDDLLTQIATVANPQSRNTFTMAVGPVPAALRIPMVRWKPRDGFNETFVEFQLNLENLFNVHGVTNFMSSIPPLVTSPVKRTKEADARVVAEAKALAQYQAINTSIYWHVVPALDVSGAARIRDLRKIQSFVSGTLADGKALIEWALGFASLASMDKQAELFITLRNKKLKSSATIEELDKFLHDTLDLWLLLAGSKRSEPLGYYKQLLVSLPTEPQQTHLVNVRTHFAVELRKWTAGHKSDESLQLDDVDEAIEALVDYARTIGLPRGDRKLGTLNYLHTIDIGDVCQ